jgi:glutamyl-tRNA reductase
VSSAAVELACKIFDRLEDKTVMLIGAGTMSELAARHLVAHGIHGMLVVNRTFDRATELARAFDGKPIPFEELRSHLHLADVVIGSTAADEHLLNPAIMHEVLRQRKFRPMFLIDMSVPRTFDARINEMDNVYLYDIDDLGGVASENLSERGREAEKAETIVEEEIDTFWRWLASLEAVPTIVALREKIEAIRILELEKTLASFPTLTAEQRQALEVMTTAIVNKILHAPITHLKQQDRHEEALYLATARKLFDIEHSEDT